MLTVCPIVSDLAPKRPWPQSLGRHLLRDGRTPCVVPSVEGRSWAHRSLSWAPGLLQMVGRASHRGQRRVPTGSSWVVVANPCIGPMDPAALRNLCPVCGVSACRLARQVAEGQQAPGRGTSEQSGRADPQPGRGRAGFSKSSILCYWQTSSCVRRWAAGRGQGAGAREEVTVAVWRGGGIDPGAGSLVLTHWTGSDPPPGGGP